MIKSRMAALTLALVAALAHADDYLSPTEDRVRLSLGVMYVSNTTDIQLDSSAGVPGTPINAESVLGLDHSDFEVKFQAMVRVGEVNRLRSTILPWIGPVKILSPHPSYFATWSCSPENRWIPA
jgi:hypothetical protein